MEACPPFPCNGPLQITNCEEGVLHNGRKGGTLFGDGRSHLEGPLPFLCLDGDRCLTWFGSPARPRPRLFSTGIPVTFHDASTLDQVRTYEPHPHVSRGAISFSSLGGLFLPGISSSGTQSFHRSSVSGIELESPGCSNAPVAESPCETNLPLRSSCQVMILLVAFFALSTRFSIIL